jgi:hypothetical protein
MTYSDECLIAALNKLAEMSEITRDLSDHQSTEVFGKTGTACEWILSATGWWAGDAQRLAGEGLSEQALRMIGWRITTHKNK